MFHLISVWVLLFYLFILLESYWISKNSNETNRAWTGQDAAGGGFLKDSLRKSFETAIRPLKVREKVGPTTENHSLELNGSIPVV